MEVKTEAEDVTECLLDDGLFGLYGLLYLCFYFNIKILSLKTAISSGRITVLHTYVWPVVTAHVTWSLGLSVTVVSPEKNGRTDRDAIWIEDSGGPCIRWGPDPMGKDNFEGGRSGPL